MPTRQEEKGSRELQEDLDLEVKASKRRMGSRELVAEKDLDLEVKARKQKESRRKKLQRKRREKM